MEKYLRDIAIRINKDCGYLKYINHNWNRYYHYHRREIRQAEKEEVEIEAVTFISVQSVGHEWNL